MSEQSDSPPPYNPSPRTSLSSIWTRVLNRVHDFVDLGVTVAGPTDVVLAIPVDDLRPRARHVQITLAAVHDIQFCEKIFDYWMIELDKVTSYSKKPDEREQQLGSYLACLREDAGLCSNATNKILKYHIQFASLMAQCIDDATKSQYGLKYDDLETTRLAKKVSKASHSLSINVTKMKNDLNLLVSALEEVQIAVKNERSLAEQILRWLKSLFEAIIRILTTVYSPISALPPSDEPRRQKSAFPVSTLRYAAAKFCTADPEPQEGKESESLDSVILFLGEIVPNEAQNTQKKLERFDEALYIKELESCMIAGQRVTLHGPDSEAVAEEWRDLAKQYQSVVEQENLYS